MARRRARTVCSTAGCPNTTDAGRCADCRSKAEQQRGSARQRGYGTEHETRFRAAVLARQPTCAVCGQQPSKHADHWPVDRAELVRSGLDPNDPRHGRGVCGRCHSSETARLQPGGWNA